MRKKKILTEEERLEKERIKKEKKKIANAKYYDKHKDELNDKQKAKYKKNPQYYKDKQKEYDRPGYMKKWRNGEVGNKYANKEE